MESSVAAADQPTGDRVASPKASPAGALSTILSRSADASLAAVRVRKIGCPLGKALGLISSWAQAGAALAATARVAMAATRLERKRMGGLSLGRQPGIPSPARSLNEKVVEST